MIIASVDIETTGLDPSWCQVLEVGVVLWDTADLVTPVRALPAFQCYVVHDRYEGEPFALAMHREIFGRIARREEGHRYLEPCDVGSALREWVQIHHLALLADNGFGAAELTPAGFNFDGFDRQFLDRLPDFRDAVKFAHRSLAPATLYFDPTRDAKVPGSDAVFRRAGVTVAPADRHTSLGDARGVIEVLRAAFRRPEGGAPVPSPTPRCPDCGDRRSVRVPTDHGEWDDVPCDACNPHTLCGFPIGRQLAIAG